MFSIRKIYNDNRATFYDYNSGALQSRTHYLIAVVITSLICAVICSEPSDNFLGAIITAQSILAGFGFNVLFFLLSNSKKLIDIRESSIEAKLRRDKLSKLAKEIFSNVSYFNLISIASVFLALVAFMPSLSAEILKYCNALLKEHFPNNAEKIGYIFYYFKLVFRIIIFAMLYALLFESVVTFVRTVTRITFYFRKRLDLLEPGN